VIANLLQGRDGNWSAIDSRTLFRHATTASYVYHAMLRGELTTSVAWTPVTKGIAEIVGVPPDLTHDLSTRRNEIENYLATSGRDDPAAAQYAWRPDPTTRRGHPRSFVRSGNGPRVASDMAPTTWSATHSSTGRQRPSTGRGWQRP
jgi:hypothetical protein